jgi:serine/threonine-protein kinase
VADTILRLSGPQEADMAPVEPAYAAVLQRALAKDRTRRFQTADEFAGALQRAANECAPTVVAAARSAPRRVWDPELLQRVERQFAVHAGPMARRTVARAAQDAASVEELYATLARTLPSAADRSAFLRAMGGARVEPTLAATRRIAATVGGSAGTVAAATVIPGAVVSSAQTALAFFVGPIARVLVRNAAMQAVSSEEFIERLCAHVANADEAAQLRRRLQAVC